MSSSPSALVNPLATATQLESSSSQLDGVPADLENSIRYEAIALVQAAGVLLRLDQDVIARAIVIFTRFWVGPEGGSLREYGAKEIAAACLYLMAKPSAYPKSPRSVLNVFGYLSANPPKSSTSATTNPNTDPEAYCISEGTYHAQRSRMVKHEAIILRTLGFQTHVALPYTLCINYLQTLDVFHHERGKEVAQRAFAHINTALLSPQLLFLTHQPPAIATAAIYLAAREIGVPLPAQEWWVVFDTDREELGFLVVALLSMEGFAVEEKKKWQGKRVPLTVEEVEQELESITVVDGDG